jgi:hypothetical protein
MQSDNVTLAVPLHHRFAQALSAGPMTEAIGPDGTLRLRCYPPSANSVWFSAGCDDLAGCGHTAPIGIRAAIRFMGPEATVRQLVFQPRRSLPASTAGASLKRADRRDLP